MQGHPRWSDPSEEFWKNVAHLEKEMATHSGILAWKTPWTVWKGKKIWQRNMSLPGWKVPSMLLGKSRGQLLILQKERSGWAKAEIMLNFGCVWCSDIPLQHSCLENPMDGGAWWAAVHGVTKHRNWIPYLKLLKIKMKTYQNLFHIVRFSYHKSYF